MRTYEFDQHTLKNHLHLYKQDNFWKRAKREAGIILTLTLLTGILLLIALH